MADRNSIEYLIKTLVNMKSILVDNFEKTQRILDHRRPDRVEHPADEEEVITTDLEPGPNLASNREGPQEMPQPEDMETEETAVSLKRSSSSKRRRRRRTHRSTSSSCLEVECEEGEYYGINNDYISVPMAHSQLYTKLSCNPSNKIHMPEDGQLGSTNHWYPPTDSIKTEILLSLSSPKKIRKSRGTKSYPLVGVSTKFRPPADSNRMKKLEERIIKAAQRIWRINILGAEQGDDDDDETQQFPVEELSNSFNKDNKLHLHDSSTRHISQIGDQPSSRNGLKLHPNPNYSKFTTEAWLHRRK